MNNDFDPYQVLMDTQKSMFELARMQNDISQQIVQLYRIQENLNRRQDILDDLIKIVINSQKSKD